MHVGMKELCGAPVSQEVFRRVLSRHTVEDWLQTLGKASRVLEQLPPAAGDLDRELAVHLGPHARRAAQVVAGGARFVSQPAINTVAREALAFGAEGLPVGFDHTGNGDLAWALLGAIDLFEDRSPLPKTASTEGDAVIASLLLRRIARPYSHLRNRLPRTHRLFIDLPRAHPELASGFDFDASCRQLSGVELARYLAISFAFHARFGMARRPEEWLLTYDYFKGATSITEEEFRAVIDTVSATPDELRSEYSAEAAGGLRGIDDHRPLVRSPICEVRPGVFIPIDFDALGERLVGDGVYWRLKPTSDPDRSRYGATVGKMLEQHLYEVIRNVYPAAADEPDRLFREKRYRVVVDGTAQPIDSPDIVLFDDDAVMVCEIGANTVNVRDTLHRGEVTSLDRDIRTVLIPRAEQLHRKITHMREGSLTFDRPITESTRIEPVICFLDGFPMAPFIRQRIDDALDAEGLLNLPNVGRLEVLSAQDFEVACGAVETRKLKITDLLAGHSARQDFGDWPLTDYVRGLLGELPMPRLLQREYQRVTAAFLDEVRPS